MRFQLVLLASPLLIACNQTPPAPQQAVPQKTAATAPKPAAVSIDEVLRWRNTYGDLLGKPKESAVDRFGQPSTEDASGVWTWEPSAKTDNRMVTISYTPKVAMQMKVYARDDEKVDPLDVLKRAPEFNLGSGTYKDSVTSYFVAETKDGRNTLQFDVGGNDVSFNAAIFK
jgi:hypothetical protein